MRQHVKPAHPDARIPDVEREDFLPPEGRDVEWSVSWLRLKMRGDILVSPPTDEEPELDGDETPDQADETSAEESATNASTEPNTAMNETSTVSKRSKRPAR